jgi:hypothetical protein
MLVTRTSFSEERPVLAKKVSRVIHIQFRGSW